MFICIYVMCIAKFTFDQYFCVRKFADHKYNSQIFLEHQRKINEKQDIASIAISMLFVFDAQISCKKTFM